MIQIEQIGDRELVIFNENNVKIVENFQPYFYVDDENGEYISLFGEKCKKILVDKPTDVIKEREKYQKTFEADIQYRERYLIDNVNVPFPKENIHIFYIDIETDMSIDVINTPKPITCLTIFSTKLNKYLTFIWREDQPNKRVGDVFYFNNEKEMLNKFLELVENLKPHLYTGWNVNFDLGYLFNRMKILNLKAEKLSPLKDVKLNNYNEVRIYGCVVFDLLEAYKKIHQNLLNSYSLKNIALKELNDFKIEIELENAWHKDLDKLIEYNIKDVELCIKIDKKLGIIDFFDEQRREIGCLWESLWFSSGKHDVALLREAKEKRIILPSKIKQSRNKFDGATVLEPTPGIYENIICLDVKSLYPSIICQFNLSPDCLGGSDIILPNGVTISTKKEGFIVEIIKKYFEKRKYYKKLMNIFPPESDDYKVNYNKQWSYKILLNSFYGYLGYVKARLFNFKIAKSIPYMGRLILLHMKNIIEKEGYKITAGDTDSIYCKMPTSDIKEIIKIGNHLTKKINDSFTDFVKQYGCKKNNWLEVEFEKINSKMFFLANEKDDKAPKKRYAYYEIWRDGQEVNKMGYIGIDLIRSDCSKVTAEITGKVFEMLLKENKSKKEIKDFINEEIIKIKNMEYSYNDIAFPKTLTSNFKDYKVKSFHVKAAEWSNKNLGTDFKQGSKFKVIYGYMKNLPFCEAFAFNDDKILKDKEIIINWERQMPILINNKIERIYLAMGWKENKNQKSLDRWSNG